MARFRAKYYGDVSGDVSGDVYYIIQKHGLFGWRKYDKMLYTAQEAIQRLMDIETWYPNVHPVDEYILKEIEI